MHLKSIDRHPLCIEDGEGQIPPPMHGDRNRVVASHFRHLGDKPFYRDLAAEALAILKEPSFPQPGYPLYIYPYALFGISDKPESWSDEVARRLKLYPILPDFEPGLSDTDLSRRFNVGIPGLSRTDLLEGILLRLVELKELFITTRRGKLEVSRLTQQIAEVKSDIKRTKKETRKRRPYSGGCPGGHIDEAWVGRRCERGYDDCDI